jgi:hypothetical protein
VFGNVYGRKCELTVKEMEVLDLELVVCQKRVIGRNGFCFNGRIRKFTAKQVT